MGDWTDRGSGRRQGFLQQRFVKAALRLAQQRFEALSGGDGGRPLHSEGQHGRLVTGSAQGSIPWPANLFFLAMIILLLMQ